MAPVTGGALTARPGRRVCLTRPVDVREEYREVEQGRLRVYRTGTGPPLLLIAGGLGAADGYRALVNRLAPRFTVIGYDRRGHFGSSDISSGPVPMARQADDAAAVLRHAGVPDASVFGTSAGAAIALALTQRHPDLVHTVVAHEPPTVRLLPEAERWLRFGDEMVALAARDPLAGYTRFVESLAGAATPGLRATRLPREDEWRRLFAREITAFLRFLPDVPTLAASPARIVPAGGVGSVGHYHHTPAVVLAERLGVPFAETTGDHLGPQRRPGPFAAELTALLTGEPVPADV